MKLVLTAALAGIFSLPAPRAQAGCDREGVAGPWVGSGVLRDTPWGGSVYFSFTDNFLVDNTTLTGHMRFQSLGVALPHEVSNFLSETYTVEFTRGETINFRSNWGSGGGNWSFDRYNMTFNDKTSLVQVEERGTIDDCDHMTVNGSFYLKGALLGRMKAWYSRP